METDLTSVVIGIAALAAFIVPILYLDYYKKWASKQLEKKFLDIARQHNATIAQSDSWRGRYVIGVDKNAGILVYLKKMRGEEDKHVVIGLSGIINAQKKTSRHHATRSS